MNWLKEIISNILNRIKTLFTSNWTNNPHVTQTLMGYAVVLTTGYILSKTLLMLLLVSVVISILNVIKQMRDNNGNLNISNIKFETLINESFYYFIGCGIGTLVVILL